MGFNFLFPGKSCPFQEAPLDGRVGMLPYQGLGSLLCVTFSSAASPPLQRPGGWASHGSVHSPGVKEGCRDSLTGSLGCQALG